MTWPGIESQSPGLFVKTLTIMPMGRLGIIKLIVNIQQKCFNFVYVNLKYISEYTANYKKTVESYKDELREVIKKILWNLLKYKGFSVNKVNFAKGLSLGSTVYRRTSF